jgi:hypothetical protein
MLNDWLHPAPPIGCEVDDRCVRLAQVQGDALVAAALPLDAEVAAALLAGGKPPHGAAVARDIARVVRAAGFRGRRVVSCMPHEQMKCRTLHLAPMPPGELLQAAHWKAATELGLKADRFKCDVIRLRAVTDGGKPREEVMAIGADLEALERHAALLADAGLEPVAIDYATCALARGLSRAAAAATEPDAPVPLLQLTEASAVFVVVRAGEVRFVRGLGAGLGRVDVLAAGLLDVRPEQVLDLRAALAAPAGGPLAGAWPVHGCAEDRARLAFDDAWRLYGRELARDVSLSARYYTGAFDAGLAESGLVVGPRRVGVEALDVLTETSGITFAPLEHLSRPEWQSAISAVSGGDAGAWLAAIGLALYESSADGGADAPPAREAA